MRYGPTHMDMLHAKDGRLPTMQAIRHWRQKLPRHVHPPQPCIFCGGAEEDAAHMQSPCERSPEVAEVWFAGVEELRGHLPLAEQGLGKD